MKQKDIALFVVVAIVSGVLSVLLSGILITPKKDKVQKAEIVDPISAEFNTPPQDSKYFNKDSVNPTKLIQIGDNTNQVPFNGSSQ
jgi:hypothetical protein